MDSTDIDTGIFLRTTARRLPHGARLALAVAAVVLASSAAARADRLIIEQPGQHPDYLFEAEPHLVLGLLDPPGPGEGSQGWGLGFRGTIELVDNGFVKTINNTIGIGFGLDWVNYDYSQCHLEANRGRWCENHEQAYLWLPVVMQWNFWLSENWSVFGEPGAALRLDGPSDDDRKLEPFVFYAGGRWHFSDAATLTLRLGYPTLSVGVSFLL